MTPRARTSSSDGRWWVADAVGLFAVGLLLGAVGGGFTVLLDAPPWAAALAILVVLNLLLTAHD